MDDIPLAFPTHAPQVDEILRGSIGRVRGIALVPALRAIRRPP